MLAYHSDADAAVPSTAYGDGVRIIPYPYPLATLGRIGELSATPDGRPWTEGNDPRQYAEPVETPEILKLFSSQSRWDVTEAGLMFNSIPAKTDRASQTLISNLAQYAASLPTADVISFTQDGAAYTITAGDAISLNSQMTTLAQQSRTVEAECLTDLGSDTPTILTYEDVEARFAGLQARTLRGKKKT